MPNALAMTSLPRAPAQEHLERLDSVFGPEYFEHGRLIITVARDIPGVMKVAHKVQSRLHESLGSVVEIIFEHVKHELWSRLHEATNVTGLQKGSEVPECQVTHIPDGIRQNPYQREHLPTFEVLLLWEDVSRETRGQCLYSVSHPAAPTLDQVDGIFKEVELYFTKRWLVVELALAPPIRGAFDEDLGGDEAENPDHDVHVGGGVAVTLLSLHAYGFATDQSETLAPHVRHCQPLAFKGMTDDAGRAKICFLPAEVNKIQVAETERFQGSEVTLAKADVLPMERGPTFVTVRLTPKALAVVTVHVFAMPKQMPKCDETDGIIDWGSEDREPVSGASVDAEQLKDGEAVIPLTSIDGGATFIVEDGGLPEGCVNLVIRCPGFQEEERAVMLLVGGNEFYVPLRRM